MKWAINHIYNYSKDRPWGNGFAHNGFFGRDGRLYMIDYDHQWMGCLREDDSFAWTAGPQPVPNSDKHITIPWNNPNYACHFKDNSFMVSSMGDRTIYRILPDNGTYNVFLSATDYGMVDHASCESDFNGNVWICEITGCKIWQFDKDARLIRVLGDGKRGFQPGTVPFDEVKLSWIYCLRCGPDGNMYFTDSRNYAVRMIDIQEQTVTTLVGTGRPGYSGDGGDPALATLGTSIRPYNGFDGPWYLALDEDLNIYIADSQNFVIRMVDRSANIISTIAGSRLIHRGKRIDPRETDPFRLNLPHVCSLEYFRNQLFVPEWRGDLVILDKIMA